MTEEFEDVEIIMGTNEIEGEINNLIDFLQKAKTGGATHYKFRFSGEYKHLFTWIETVKLKQ